MEILASMKQGFGSGFWQNSDPRLRIRSEFYRIRAGDLDLEHQWTSRHQKYETKKKAFKVI